MPTFDLIVIGAGAVGSAAAYHAAKTGRRVLLLEQYELDHQRGSSYGLSRIIRYVYDHPIYINLARAAYPAWRALEDEAGERLMLMSGGISFAPPGDDDMARTLSAMSAMNVPFELIDADELARRYPQFTLPPDMQIVVQDDTAVLRASRCVLAQLRLAEARGAVIRDNTPVITIRPQVDGVEVTTGDETYSAGRLIIAAGGWMRLLMGALGLNLPLQPIAAQENYFIPAQPEAYEIGRIPVFLAQLGRAYGSMIYSIPSVDGSGFKLALHGGAPLDPTGERVPDLTQIAKLDDFAARYLPGATAEHKQSRVCIYTMTPDEHFIIDRHPEYSHIVYASPCSGHGFKFSTVIGSILSDLAFDGRTTHDISLFRLNRFDPSTA